MSVEIKKEFEIWASQYNLNGHTPLRDGNSYFHRETAIAWEAYQCAWEASKQSCDRKWREDMNGLVMELERLVRDSHKTPNPLEPQKHGRRMGIAESISYIRKKFGGGNE